MKTYHVVVTDDAKADLKRYRDYILKKFKNLQAAKALILDFRETRKVTAPSGVFFIPVFHFKC